jgi:hypothetical protein
MLSEWAAWHVNTAPDEFWISKYFQDVSFEQDMKERLLGPKSRKFI